MIERTRIAWGGKTLYGARVGILMLETRFPRIPGDMGNAETWPFAVLYKVVPGASPRRVVCEKAEGLLDEFLAAAAELVRQGADGITTTCGFLSLYQREIAAHVGVPVATSSLMQIPFIERVLPPGGAQDAGVVQVRRDGRRVQRRRHHHQLEVGTAGALQAAEQREREIAFQVALVEFIQHHGRHALQRRFRKQTPGEYPLSDKSQARAWAYRFFKPDLVSDRLADRFAEFPCHSTRRQSRRYSARFEHNHFTAHDSEKRRWYSGGLPRTGSSHDHKVRAQS